MRPETITPTSTWWGACRRYLVPSDAGQLWTFVAVLVAVFALYTSQRDTPVKITIKSSTVIEYVTPPPSPRTPSSGPRRPSPAMQSRVPVDRRRGAGHWGARRREARASRSSRRSDTFEARRLVGGVGRARTEPLRGAQTSLRAPRAGNVRSRGLWGPIYLLSHQPLTG